MVECQEGRVELEKNSFRYFASFHYLAFDG